METKERERERRTETTLGTKVARKIDKIQIQL